MSFVEAIRSVLHRYADFSGRASRPELWWWFLTWGLVTAALGLLSVVPPGRGGSLGSVPVAVWGLSTLLPTLAVGVRRLRDAGRGWANLLWAVVPVGGVVVLAVLWAQPPVAAGRPDLREAGPGAGDDGGRGQSTLASVPR